MSDGGPGKLEVSEAAKSGDGSLEKVGIKVTGKFKSPITNQCFDSQEAIDMHHSDVYSRG